MKDRQMLFQDANLAMEPEFLELIDLFASGLHWLGLLEKEKGYACYSDWIKLVKTARSNDNRLDDKKLTWLWEAITSEPGIKKKLADRIVSLGDEWKNTDPFQCLPENSEFGIFLKGFQSYGYPAHLKNIKDIQPDAIAKIQTPLLLRPGKAQRLECCDVSTKLYIRFSKELSKQQEALLFKVDEDDIEIDKDTVIVDVKSLNHAYTKASLRLQPNRRSPGGKAYNHVALKLNNNIFEPLEEIRRKNEEQIWSDLKK